MSIEGGGGIGGGIGGAGGLGAGFGGGIGVGGGLGGGIEAGGSMISVGVPAVASLEASFGPAMGLPDISPIVNEGPFTRSIADFNPIRPVAPDLGGTRFPLEQFNVDVVPQAEAVADRAWDLFTAPDVITEAEIVLSEAQKPVIFSPATLDEFSPVEWAGRGKGWGSDGDRNWDSKKAELAIAPQVEPMIVPFMVPNGFEFPKPEVVISPALEPAIQAGPQTETGAADEVKQATVAQPVLQEQEVEEVVTERITAKQNDIAEEEIEKFQLKVVVDEEVLENRITGLMGIAGIVEAKSKGREIDGNEIVVLAPPESKKERSGIIKEHGPDGSWVETLEEIASRKFQTLKEAKKQIVEIITRKVPVKRGKEGKTVGFEAVARVLKYLFVKYQPVEQIITRVVKKQKVLAKEGQKPLQIVPVAKSEATGSRIENLGLAEVFPKH